MDKLRNRRAAKVAVVILSAAGLIAGGIVGGIAIASHNSGHVLLTGKSLVGTRIVTQEKFSQHSTAGHTAWTSLPGSGRSVSVPSGSQRLLVATLTAETRCTGAAGTWCSARVVARRKSGSTTKYEFYPKSIQPDSFALDTATGSDDQFESHGVKRARKLGAGTWSVFVEVSTTTDGTTLWIDDWLFSVDIHTV